MRPSWDAYHMGFAYAAASRSSCPRASVGAVAVRDNRVLATGYNGAPPGVPECTRTGCRMEDGHCVGATHAEINALLHAARHGISILGATMYVTHTPCYRCARDMISAGIERVVYASDYRVDPMALGLLDLAGVTVDPYVGGRA